ncbi:MAG: VOC family protein [Reichenbachiella sp.]|uniref:VOC family protein n=1 Tax=Reichenbachiella sp. TaxID=2184521 RepID=UPI0032656AA2
MSNQLSHFAVFTEDMDRAISFYGNVFNWVFNNHDSSGFAQVSSESGENGRLIGALQDRKYQLTEEKVIGFECSISVDNVDAVAQLVLDHGGKILMPKTEIPHVGWLIKFKDTEGNIVCAMQYQEHIRNAMNT